MKLGMYGDTPQVDVWDFIISQYSDTPWDTKIWIDASNVKWLWEWVAVEWKLLESILIEFFNKHF